MLHLIAAKPINSSYRYDAEKDGERVSRLFKYLIKLGLDPMVEDGRQRTSLDVAAANQNEAVLKLFERDGDS